MGELAEGLRGWVYDISAFHPLIPLTPHCEGTHDYMISNKKEPRIGLFLHCHLFITRFSACGDPEDVPKDEAGGENGEP